MANKATVVLQVTLNPHDEVLNSDIIEEVLSDLKILSYEDFLVNYQSDNIAEIEMSTAWVAPTDDFQKICDFYGCLIYGVAFEFGNSYVEAFELYSNENHYDEITKNPKKGYETIEKLPINEEV